MKHLSLLLRTAIGRRRILATTVVLLGMAVLARLGFWQLDRLEQRRAFNAQLLQALESPPLDLTREELVGDFESMKNRDVVVQGEFDISRQIILKLQNRAGQPGVHLVSPLLIEGTGNAVLVDRGWIPESESGPEADSKFSEPGPVTVYGFVALSQTLSRPAPEDSLPSGPQREWYRVDIEAIQSQMPYELMPFYVTQSPGEDGDDELPFRDEREIDLSEGSHLGYAIQWFIFSATLGIIYIVYLGKANPPSQGEA